MEIVIGLYLVIAGCLGAAKSEGIIKDDTVKTTYEFEKHVAEIKGDKALVIFLDSRLKEMRDK